MRTPQRAGAVAALLVVVCAALVPPAMAAEIDVPTASSGTVSVIAADEAGAVAEAKAAVSAMSLREQAASVVMGHIPTTDEAALRAYMQESGIGGFILMGANVPGDEDALRAVTSALTVNAAFPPLLAIDQEGGDVSRLPWDGFPSARTLKDEPASAAESAFAGRGALVRRAGVGVNFGIVADVTSDPSSFIYRRALGTGPESSAERVVAAVQGERPYALSTLKHFPGHGAAPGDSHAGIPSSGMSYDQWRATDGIPFEEAIEADAPLLMFGHLAYTAIDETPASLSAEWHRIAREDLGFEGVVVTDDLGMLQSSGRPEYADPVANAVAALVAGNDLVLTVVFSTPETASRTVDGIIAAVESGALPSERLREASERVTLLRLSIAAGGRGLLPCAECAPAE